MFIPELNLECDLLRCCCANEDGEIEVTSDNLRESMSKILDVDIPHVYFAPDADCAPVGIVAEYEPYDDRDPWLCYPVVLTPDEIKHFHLEPWQLLT